jgi:hypothetical protein
VDLGSVFTLIFEEPSLIIQWREMLREKRSVWKERWRRGRRKVGSTKGAKRRGEKDKENEEEDEEEEEEEESRRKEE